MTKYANLQSAGKYVVLGFILGVVMGVILTQFIPSRLMDKGRADGIAAVEKLLNLASKGQYAEIESSGLAGKDVVSWLRERDKRWGKVKSIAFEDAYVQILGTPWGVTMKVWRERKAVRELFGGSGSTVQAANIPWPDAEN